jgi:DNA (cytosine-5)-methyltransferase 1
MSEFKVCSLFSGIGGFERGLSRVGFEPILMCENDPAAQAVLKSKFPDCDLQIDVRKISKMPSCDVLTAGWPCQDLSQAGKTAGFRGAQSGLVSEVFRLIRASKRKPQFIILENVAFALHLDSGNAVKRVTGALEELGYNWAYRILDTRGFGLPQRRRRLFIVGALRIDPRQILFDGSANDCVTTSNIAQHVGFYWTEGNRGLGWSPEAVPPLKGGSSFSIPSPPAIWQRSSSSFFAPSITDAERLQGFPKNWTIAAAETEAGPKSRWRLVGNAVSVPVIEWLGKRIEYVLGYESSDKKYEFQVTKSKSPNLGFGGPKNRAEYHAIKSEWPSRQKLVALTEFKMTGLVPLSQRAAAGFLRRFKESSLKKDPDFLRDLERYA